MVGKLTAFCLIAMVAVPTLAQTPNDSLQSDSHLFYKELNRLNNMYDGTCNPVELSHNQVKMVSDAYFLSHFENGSFHAMDAGNKVRNLGASVSGLYHYGRLDVSGYFEYINANDDERKWNTTLFLSPTNPFILADAIASDMKTEMFKMSAAASYQFNDRFTGALSLFYKTGSLSDQTDPRPKTNAMHFEINPGVEFAINKNHRIGVSANVDIFRSDLSYSIVNNNTNYIYYVMKGMGDFLVRTSNDFVSYPRDYEGLSYKGALQWMASSQSGRLNNMLEFSYAANKEEGNDGGYAFTFKSGDYNRKDLFVYDRFNIKSNNRFQQNISLKANYATDQGDWYDQKKLVDPEHGNMPFYQILNKSKIREVTYMNAEFAYQADWLRNQMPDFSAYAKVGFENMQAKQYYTAVFKQNYSLLAFQLGARKHWKLGKWRMNGELNGHYQMPMGDAEYACTKSDIEADYVAPSFEYATTARMGFHAAVGAYLPVKVYNYQTWMGVKVRVASEYYLGDSDFSTRYEGSSRTLVDAAFNIKF